jgi:hypothetical protein
MKKVISFSLWGDDKLYCQGAIENVACAKKYYPDWVCRFYIEESCPAIPALSELDCELYIVGDRHNKGLWKTAIDRTQDPSVWHNDYANIGMMWRFGVIDDPNVDIAVFRDCDSRVGARDAQAVQEWLKSGMAMHRMHECREHWNAQVMGGMWGIYPGSVHGDVTDSITNYIENYEKIRKEPWIFVDLWWIMDCLWPVFHQSCMGHGYGHPNPFVVDGPIVGGVVNEEWRGQKYVQ